MSRGKKLDIFIGADIKDGWSKIEQTPKKQVLPQKMPNEHRLKFTKEKRRGKTVTIVGEFYMSGNELKQILKDIKSKFGCGGSYKDGYMQFQGDLRDALKIKFQELGFK